MLQFYIFTKRRVEFFGISELSGRLLWKETGAGEAQGLDPVQSLLLIYSVTQPLLATSIFYKTEITLDNIT